jgi:transposase
MENAIGVFVAEAAAVAASASRIEIVTERRPAYSADFRARVVEESLVPGVRALDLAVRHGIHVSLIHRWCRMARLQDGDAGPGQRRRARSTAAKNVAVNPSAAFIPIGVLGPPGSQMPSATDVSASVARHDRGERRGMIEIDMVGGTRLRVDASVDEQAFRLVWGVLKSMS